VHRNRWNNPVGNPECRWPTKPWYVSGGEISYGGWAGGNPPVGKQVRSHVDD